MTDSHATVASRRVFLSPRLARNDLALRLQREMQGDVLFDAASRGRYATDASIYQIQPLGVAVPRSEADLAIALDVARDLKVPVLRVAVVPRSAARLWVRPWSLTTPSGWAMWWPLMPSRHARTLQAPR